MEPQRTLHLVPPGDSPQMICCCRLREHTGGYDSCSRLTSGTDEPICPDCVDCGHPRQDNFDPTIKNVRSNL